MWQCKIGSVFLISLICAMYSSVRLVVFRVHKFPPAIFAFSHFSPAHAHISFDHISPPYLLPHSTRLTNDCILHLISFLSLEDASHMPRSFFCSSSSPRVFPIICRRQNGYEYHSSTLSCPVRPPPLTPHFPYLFYTSLSTWFSVFPSVSFLVLVHLTFFLVRALRPFS